jgi:hypothetical protein
MRYSSLCLVLLVILARSVHGQQSAPTPKIHVQLTISASDGLDHRLRSYFSRELRKINDVEIDDSTPVLQLDVVALRDRSGAGQELGYTLSVVVTSLDDRALVLAFATQLPEAQRKFLEENLSKEGTLVNHLVYTAQPERLPELCAKIVAEFDGKHLEAHRKSNKQLIEMYKALPK